MSKNKSLSSQNRIYGQDYVNKYREKKGEGRIERLLKLLKLKNSDVILDVGCGSGFLVDYIKDDVKKYVGIDTSPAFIKEAKKTHQNIENIKFFNENIENHTKRNLKYDKVFLFDITEHLTDKELVSILICCSKILRNNGVVYIHTPNKNYFLEQMKSRGLIKQTIGHIKVRNGKEYKSLIKDVNRFSSVNFVYLNHYKNILKPFHILSFLPFIGKYFIARIFIEIKK
ncbi:MAG: class I SAM-dependent methyltransferase [Candidatus Pacebacteria bacterium]|nr:class I SAM-dependent methyltransferase [Candidatus Paceibacterota bacterium]